MAKVLGIRRTEKHPDQMPKRDRFKACVYVAADRDPTEAEAKIRAVRMIAAHDLEIDGYHWRISKDRPYRWRIEVAVRKGSKGSGELPLVSEALQGAINKLLQEAKGIEEQASRLLARQREIFAEIAGIQSRQQMRERRGAG